MEHNSSDRKQVQKKEEAAIAASKQEIEDVKAILRLPEGERFFTRIFRHVECISMTGNSYTYFNEGMRNMAKLLWKDAVIADSTKAARISISVYNEQGEE